MGVVTVFVALAAVLIPASVTAVGLVVSQRSDARERNRLRLDAAMRSAALFGEGSKEGAEATPAARASALLALTQLGCADLAVALLVDTWSIAVDADPPAEGDTVVSTEAAILVLNTALLSESPEAQLVAAELLCRNARRLHPCQSLHWPACLDGRWLPDLAPRAKLLVFDALVRMTTHAPPSENALRSLVVRLYAMWDGDPDPRVRGCVGRLVGCVLPAVAALPYTEFMGGTRLVTYAQLDQAARSASPNPDGYLERLVEDRGATLHDWALTCTACSFHPGALATAADELAARTN
jgi:hypothetical protein